MNEGKLVVMGHDGDQEIPWTDLHSTEAARAEFDRLLRAGYVAFGQDSSGRGKLLSEFDPNASEIVLSPQFIPG
jgi:hypothetical protein